MVQDVDIIHYKQRIMKKNAEVIGPLGTTTLPQEGEVDQDVFGIIGYRESRQEQKMI